MPKFIVKFCTGSAWAEIEIAARTPKQALRLARQLATASPLSLDFQPYDLSLDVEDIDVCDESGMHLANWMAPALLARLAAPELLIAAKLVVARWETGDLTQAVRRLSEAVHLAGG